MASAVLICNMALAHIGGEATVTSIAPPDGSVESGHCATFYSIARTEMLESGGFAFSLARASLAEATNPSTVWAYAYAKPSDCLRALRILRTSASVTVFTQDAVDGLTHDRGAAPYDIEGDLILTNAEDAVLVYIRDVTDTSKFTPSFTTALSYLLSSYLAGPIIKGNEGIRLGDAMRERAMMLADSAAAMSANSSNVEGEITLAQVRG